MAAALPSTSTCWRPRLASPVLQRPRHLAARRPAPCRASAGQTQVEAAQQAADQIPPGCSRYSISIKKPLGIVLEENKDTGAITVVEVAEESNAAKTGLVSVGDQLIATSGVTYARESDYNGAKVKMGQEVVRLSVLGESFKTVAAAIKSHPGHMEVTLEFQRCSPSQ